MRGSTVNWIVGILAFIITLAVASSVPPAAAQKPKCYMVSLELDKGPMTLNQKIRGTICEN